MFIPLGVGAVLSSLFMLVDGLRVWFVTNEITGRFRISQKTLSDMLMLAPARERLFGTGPSSSPSEAAVADEKGDGNGEDGDGGADGVRASVGRWVRSMVPSRLEWLFAAGMLRFVRRSAAMELDDGRGDSEAQALMTWGSREEDGRVLAGWLQGPPRAVTFIAGPTGSGKDAVADDVLSGRVNKLTLSLDAIASSAEPDGSGTMRALAQAVGFFPTLMWMTAALKSLELLIASTTGVSIKTSGSTGAGSASSSVSGAAFVHGVGAMESDLDPDIQQQIVKVLEVTAIALHRVALKVRMQDEELDGGGDDEGDDEGDEDAAAAAATTVPATGAADQAEGASSSLPAAATDDSPACELAKGLAGVPGVGNGRGGIAMSTFAYQSQHGSLPPAQGRLGGLGGGTGSYDGSIVWKAANCAVERIQSRREANASQYPVVMVKGFTSQFALANPWLARALLTWANALAAGSIAHVVFVSDPSVAEEQLRASTLSGRHTQAVFLADAKIDHAISYVERALRARGVLRSGQGWWRAGHRRGSGSAGPSAPMPAMAAADVPAEGLANRSAPASTATGTPWYSGWIPWAASPSAAVSVAASPVANAMEPGLDDAKEHERAVAAVALLGGRLSDLQLLVKKMAAGASAVEAVDEIVMEARVQLGARAMQQLSGDGGTTSAAGNGIDGRDEEWSARQFWRLVEAFGTDGAPAAIDYYTLLFGPAFKGDRRALSAFARSNVLSVIQQRSPAPAESAKATAHYHDGRHGGGGARAWRRRAPPPSSSVGGEGGYEGRTLVTLSRPVLLAAVRQLSSDPRVGAGLRLAAAKEDIKDAEASIRKITDELAALSHLGPAGVERHAALVKRRELLLQRLQKENDNIAASERAASAAKKMLASAALAGT